MKTVARRNTTCGAGSSAELCGCQGRRSRRGGSARTGKTTWRPVRRVGPDGVQDARIHLSGVSTRVAVKAIRIEGTGAAKWESGANPQLLATAEFWADPKKQGDGDLFFQPDRDLKGQKLKVVVLYANETLDAATVSAGRFDPKLKVPQTPLPRLIEAAVKARWLGQDRSGCRQAWETFMSA